MKIMYRFFKTEKFLFRFGKNQFLTAHNLPEIKFYSYF